MFGNMMHRPLSIIEILRFSVEAHPKAEIVSVRTEVMSIDIPIPSAIAGWGNWRML